MVERLATRKTQKQKTQKHFILLASRFVAQLTIGHQNMRAHKNERNCFQSKSANSEISSF
jgi:hypothetical protein